MIHPVPTRLVPWSLGHLLRKQYGIWIDRMRMPTGDTYYIKLSFADDMERTLEILKDYGFDVLEHTSRTLVVQGKNVRWSK